MREWEWEACCDARLLVPWCVDASCRAFLTSDDNRHRLLPRVTRVLLLLFTEVFTARVKCVHGEVYPYRAEP